MVDPDELKREFGRRFGRAPCVYRAPGRVNLIGEHTDYNDGLVMPMALDRSTWVAAAPRGDRTLVVASLEYRETVSIDLDNHPPYPTESWIDYVRGVAAVLGTKGADMLVASDVPIGAGLSSSAALEIAAGYALLDLAGAEIDFDALARAGQRAEHEFVGTHCGIMDQMIACYGQAGSAMLLDTRTLHHRSLPLPSSLRVIVGNTMVRHELASGEYNVRRADCESGVRALAARFPHVRALRDASMTDLDAARDEMPERVYRRCRHVVTENARVEAAGDALIAGDFDRFGQLMNESHRSLRDDYEVSCCELDTMSAIARDIAGVYGARMTGAGFGGCIVALADASRADAIEAELRARYETATARRPDVFMCTAGERVGEAR